MGCHGVGAVQVQGSQGCKTRRGLQRHVAEGAVRVVVQHHVYHLLCPRHDVAHYRVERDAQVWHWAVAVVVGRNAAQVALGAGGRETGILIFVSDSGRAAHQGVVQVGDAEGLQREGGKLYACPGRQRVGCHRDVVQRDVAAVLQGYGALQRVALLHIPVYVGAQYADAGNVELCHRPTAVAAVQACPHLVVAAFGVDRHIGGAKLAVGIGGVGHHQCAAHDGDIHVHRHTRLGHSRRIAQRTRDGHGAVRCRHAVRHIHLKLVVVRQQACQAYGVAHRAARHHKVGVELALHRRGGKTHGHRTAEAVQPVGGQGKHGRVRPPQRQPDRVGQVAPTDGQRLADRAVQLHLAKGQRMAAQHH